jgi:hypothetical protein
MGVLNFSVPGAPPPGDPAEDVRQRIVRIYTSLCPGGKAPADGERGELDSLAFLEFIVSIEQEFGIVINTEDLEGTNFATTASTTAYVRRKLASDLSQREYQ